MSTHESVVAVYGDVQQAERAIEILKEHSVREQDISVVARGRGDVELVKEDLLASDESAREALTGAELGGLTGALAGAAVAAAAGLGGVFFIGPLAGAYVGAIAGGSLGGLGGWGVHADRIKHYEKLVSHGNVLVVVHGDPLQLAKSHRILRDETDPVELHLYASSDEE